MLSCPRTQGRTQRKLGDMSLDTLGILKTPEEYDHTWTVLKTMWLVTCRKGCSQLAVSGLGSCLHINTGLRRKRNRGLCLKYFRQRMNSPPTRKLLSSKKFMLTQTHSWDISKKFTESYPPLEGYSTLLEACPYKQNPCIYLQLPQTRGRTVPNSECGYRSWLKQTGLMGGPGQRERWLNILVMCPFLKVYLVLLYVYEFFA